MDSTKTMTETLIQSNRTSVEVPEGAKLIDDVFYGWKTRFGLHSSMTKAGRKMLTGLHEDSVIDMTRRHLKCEQEGWPEGSVRVVNSGVVDGKL